MNTPENEWIEEMVSEFPDANWDGCSRCKTQQDYLRTALTAAYHRGQFSRDQMAAKYGRDRFIEGQREMKRKAIEKFDEDDDLESYHVGDIIKFLQALKTD